MSDQNTDCGKEAIIHQLLKVQAQVTVTPIIKDGRPRVYCIDSDIRPACDDDEDRRAYYQRRRESEDSDGKCTFTVTQVLCVEIPISVDVDVDVDQGIVRCGRPEFGPCEHPRKELDCMDQSEELNPSDDE